MCNYRFNKNEPSTAIHYSTWCLYRNIVCWCNVHTYIVSYVVLYVIITTRQSWHVITPEQPCHEEQDLVELVRLLCLPFSFFVSVCECVCAPCFNSMCTPHYMHNVIPGIPCFVCAETSLSSIVLWQIAVQKGSAVFMSTNTPANHALPFWFALADCCQRWSDICGSYKSIMQLRFAFFSHPLTKLTLHYNIQRILFLNTKIGPSLNCLRRYKMAKLHVVLPPQQVDTL